MEFSKKLKKVMIGVLSAFTFASAVTVSAQPTTVSAAGGLDVNSAINNYITIGDSSLHYSFNGGNNFDVIMTGSKDQLQNVGLDCTAGAVAIVAHAIKDAGGNPYEYFGMLNGVLNTVYPPSLRAYFEGDGHWTTVANSPVDANSLLPGDILIYGTSGNGHMAVYTGNGQMFDFRSNGHGSNANYRGFANWSEYTTATAASNGTGTNVLSGVYRAIVTKDISVSVVKKSDCPTISDGNPNYADLTATFGVYTDAGCTDKLGTITTDKSGNGSKKFTDVSSSLNTVYIKEESAPTNYQLSDTTVHTVDVSGGSGSTEFSDTPLNDPAQIRLIKVDSNGKKVTADMSGAEFTFKYYTINPNSVNSAADVESLTPTRTWVYKTAKHSETYGINFQDVNDLVKEKSSEPYIDEKTNRPCVPFGVLTVQETKPADSYTTEGGYFKTGSVQMDANGIMFFKVNSKNSISNMLAGNEGNADVQKTERSIRGTISIQKHDAETNLVTTQGDTSFAGTKYDLYYVDHITQPGKGITVKIDANNDGTYEEFNPGDKICEVTLDENGQYTFSDNFLEYGQYKLVETTAPDGYSLNDADGNVRSYTFEISEDGTATNIDTQETPKFGDVQIYKHYNDKKDSEVDDVPEENAEFFIILKSKLDALYNGDVDAAIKATEAGTDELTSHEWAKVKTNKKGIATAKDLAIGTYVLRQTKGNEESIILPYDYTFKVTSDDVADDNGTKPTPILLSVTNDYKPYIIEFDKYDSYTNQMISMTSASFKIKNKATGEYVVQEVGGKKYDTFKTHSLNEGKTQTSFYIIPDAKDSDLGKAVTPLSLKTGTYTIEEVETPDNFVTVENFDIEVNVNEVARVTEDGKYVKLVNVKNTPVLGELNVKKAAELVEGADINLLDADLDLSKIKFELRAAEDIINPDDGTVLVKKGDIATDLNHNVIGAFNVDRDGNATVKEIPLGKYLLHEVETVPGLALEETPTEVEFKAVDHNTPVVPVEINLTNHETDTKFTKTDVTGEQEIPGAHLVIKDEAGKVVTEWDSTDKPVEIAGIPEGNYTLTETIAPEGFVKRTTTVSFTVKGSEVSTVKMENKTYDFTKVDAGGEEVEGAKMQVFELKDGNITGNPVDEWTSTKDVHRINGLEEGKSYRIHEEVAAEGYVKASDIDITVTSDYTKNQEVSMIDKQMIVTKTDIGGKEVPGAVITVTDKDGNVVDTWTSTKEPHPVNNLEVGKTYTLKEDTAPLGYVTRTEVTFTVLDDGLDQSFELVDTIERASKLDENGSYVTGATMQAVDTEGNVVDTWVTGQHIVDISNENKAAMEKLANGESVTWELEDGTTVEVVAVVSSNEATKQEPVDDIDSAFGVDEESATKQDATDVIDPEFSTEDEATALTDETAGEDVENEKAGEIRKYSAFITNADGVVSTYDIDAEGNETSHRIANLVEGQKYTISEVAAPKGLYFAQEQDLTAGEDSTDHERTFVDRPVKYLIEKVDENGAPVEGVTLKLTDVTVDDEGKLVNTDDNGQPAVIPLPNNGVTTKEPFELDGVLEAGHNYRLEETEWVNGVYKATDIYFNVDKYGDPSTPVITITMVDALAKVTVNKVDASGKPLAGAKMQVIEAEIAEDPNRVTENEAVKDDSKLDDDAYTVDEEASKDSTKLDDDAFMVGDDEAAALDDENGVAVDSQEAAKPAETDKIDEGFTADDASNEAVKPGADDEFDNGYTLPDSEIQYVPAKDKDGNDKVVYEFTSTDDKNGVDISQYVKGDKTYILREVEAPYGYNKIDDQVFTVTGTSASYQVIYAIDTPKQYGIEITKTNTAGTKKLAGAEFALINASTGKIARDVNGNSCKGKTNSEGKLTFNVFYNNSKEGYYFQELTAPKGYVLDQTKHAVKLSGDYKFVEAMKYTITNREEGVPSGVSAPVAAIIGGCAVLAVGGYFLISKKKKKSEDGKDNAE